jgi:hypothetical protein
MANLAVRDKKGTRCTLESGLVGDDGGARQRPELGLDDRVLGLRDRSLGLRDRFLDRTLLSRKASLRRVSAALVHSIVLLAARRYLIS